MQFLLADGFSMEKPISANGTKRTFDLVADSSNLLGRSEGTRIVLCQNEPFHTVSQ
jgi:hypothetical protein